LPGNKRIGKLILDFNSTINSSKCVPSKELPPTRMCVAGDWFIFELN